MGPPASINSRVVWIAGSALSHQFTEHEQPDLDALIGVNYPLFYQDNGYALRKGLTYSGRADGMMSAFMIRPGG